MVRANILCFVTEPYFVIYKSFVFVFMQFDQTHSKSDEWQIVTVEHFMLKAKFKMAAIRK